MKERLDFDRLCETYADIVHLLVSRGNFFKKKTETEKKIDFDLFW